MPSFGPVPVPEPPVITEFPLQPDYTSAEEYVPVTVDHRFDSPGLKTEQRYWRGNGARRFRVKKAQLTCREYETLRDHWTMARGIHARFPYTHPKQDGSGDAVSVRYADPVMQFEHQAALLVSDPGLLLIQSPAYAAPVAKTVLRAEEGIPSAALADALRKGEQTLVPLVKITPKSGENILSVSDRWYDVNGALWHPRLLSWSGLRQSIDQNNDSATFRFANADGVWTELFKTVSLHRADIQLSFYDEITTVLFHLWKGTIRDWSRDPASRVIDLRAGEGVYELNLLYPTRQISRTCWKEFKSQWCPYEGPLTVCAKSWEQCVERGMTKYFGGAVVKPQGVRIQDNSSGTWGWGRSMMKSVSIADETIYQRVMQEIFTDLPMVVNCDVATGRDESDFYSALGIVGEGPVTGFSTDLTKHLLDGQPPHDPQKGGGWRYATGTDPAPNQDFFGLSQAPWSNVPAGSTYSGGTAFAEIRRTDAKGLQLSKVSDRRMSVTVTGGMGGWTWANGPGQRGWTQPLTNPVWIAANAFLRGVGLKADYSRPDEFPQELMEQYLHIPSIAAAAAICDLDVPKLVGTGSERQFPYRGTLREQKPLRDWIQEILSCCLGFSYIVNGRLAIGVRHNSSVLAGNAFTRATVLENSATAEPYEPPFNHLTVEFADDEFNWALNSVQIYDIDHARFEGNWNAPRFRANRFPLSGVSNKSQASRIAMARLKESLGGATLAEQQKARHIRFRSTMIALGTMPGDVISFDDAALPDGRIEGRVTARTINPDWTIDFEASPSTDSMYDTVAGPKPDDIAADPVPPERFPSPQGAAWLPNEVAPFAGDPLVSQTELNFALWQEYSISRTGDWEAALVVKGERTINVVTGYEPPMIHNVTFAYGNGGTIPSGRTWYVAIAHRDASAGGRYSPLSNIAAVWVPQNAQTARIVIGNITTANTTLPGHAVWLGPDVRRMSLQTDDPATPPPAVGITLYEWKELTSSPPSPFARRIRVKAKQVHHSGVAGLLVQQVVAPDRIVSSEWVGSADNWIGQYLSVVADWSDGSVPLWNFRITAFDPASGTITVDPPCVRGTPEDSVEPGDVMIVRAKVTAATANTVTCALWRNSVAQNQFGTDGLNPEKEPGLQVRVLYGKGRGQSRLVTAATQDTHTVDPPWLIVPDTTSVIIVEAPEWTSTSESSDPSVEEGGQDAEIRVRVANLADHVALVGGFLVDDQELETFEHLAVYREVFVFGEPYGVRAVGADGESANQTDQTLRVDTSAGDVDLDLTQASPYYGRSLLVVNAGIGAGAGRVIVHPAQGDEFATGETTVIIEKPGDWAEFVAGGDPAAPLGRNARHWRRDLRPGPFWRRGGSI